MCLWHNYYGTLYTTCKKCLRAGILSNLDPYKLQLRSLQLVIVIDAQKVHLHPCYQATNQFDQCLNQLDTVLSVSMGFRNLKALL